MRLLRADRLDLVIRRFSGVSSFSWSILRPCWRPPNGRALDIFRLR